MQPEKRTEEVVASLQETKNASKGGCYPLIVAFLKWEEISGKWSMRDIAGFRVSIAQQP